MLLSTFHFFFKKNILYLVCIHPLWFCLIQGYIIKQIFHITFLISELFTLDKIIFNSATFRWILITWSMKYEIFAYFFTLTCLVIVNFERPIIPQSWKVCCGLQKCIIQIICFLKSWYSYNTNLHKPFEEISLPHFDFCFIIVLFEIAIMCLERNIYSCNKSYSFIYWTINKWGEVTSPVIYIQKYKHILILSLQEVLLEGAT